MQSGVVVLLFAPVDGRGGFLYLLLSCVLLTGV